MPLFFMLSGFSLTVVYGRQPLANTSTVGGHAAVATTATIVEEDGVTPPPKQASSPFPRRHFYQNRLARVLPVYYFCCIASIPLWVFGLEQVMTLASFVPTVVLSVIPLSTFASWIPVAHLVAPAWFVCTMIPFWALFPCFLEKAQQMTDTQLVRRIGTCFVVQFTVLHVLYQVLLPYWGHWAAFSTATKNPISRVPVFLMGVYAGVLVSRHPVVSMKHDDDGKDDDVPDSLPWPTCLLGFWPLPPCDDGDSGSGGGENRPNNCCWKLLPPAPTSQRGWSRLATTQSLVLFLLTLSLGALDTVLRLDFGSKTGVLGAYWLQSVVAMTQLNILVAFTRDGGSSLASKALRTPLAQWLGKLSMNIYLSHSPVILYFVFLVLRKAKPNPVKCTDIDTDTKAYTACLEEFHEYQLMPLWGVFVIVPLTLLVSVGLYRYVEVPGRRLLQWKGGGGRK